MTENQVFNIFYNNLNTLMPKQCSSCLELAKTHRISKNPDRLILSSLKEMYICTRFGRIADSKRSDRLNSTLLYVN